jgi:hypothetical protein
MCTCPSSKKGVYYTVPQLFSHLQGGRPTGSAPSLSAKEVTICTECGVAEFLIDESELRWFHARQDRSGT